MGAHGLGVVVATLVGLTACSPTLRTSDAPSADGGADGGLVVAAAADLRPAFTAIAERFTAETGIEVVLTFGSTGRLTQQVVEGAPMDVLAAADATYVDRVLAAGIGDAASRTTYAIGRIVVWSATEDPSAWRDLATLASDPRVRTLAIANPDHAPYGRAARAALEGVGAWDALEGRVVLGDNVADAQRLAASGNADVAIVALSLAIAADEAGQGRWVLVDDALHPPLVQDMLVVSRDEQRALLARRFVAFVASADGRAIMERYGFTPPDGDAPGQGG